MSDPLQDLFRPGAVTTNAFGPNSRYYGIATGTRVTSDGTVHNYVRRRFIPPPEDYADLTEHAVVQGDRLDNITNLYLGDPEQFWRVADPNNVIDPNELSATLGRRIRITLPAGIPDSSF